jgi:hypothetical protein
MTQKAPWPPLVWSNVGRCAMATNRSASCPLYPCTALTETLSGDPVVSIASHQPVLGFSPFSCERCRKGAGEWRRGGASGAPRHRRRAAAGERLWTRGARPVTAGEGGAIHVERRAGPEQEAGRRREHLRHTAFFVKPAMTTLPTRREPTRSLVLSCAISPP